MSSSFRFGYLIVAFPNDCKNWSLRKLLFLLLLYQAVNLAVSSEELRLLASRGLLLRARSTLENLPFCCWQDPLPSSEISFPFSSKNITRLARRGRSVALVTLSYEDGTLIEGTAEKLRLVTRFVSILKIQQSNFTTLLICHYSCQVAK